MSRISYVWDKTSETWVEAAHSRKRRAPSGPQVMRDLAPYKAAAADKRTGKRPMIDGRAEHREFLRRNGYREVGNEYVEPVKTGPQRNDVVSDIKRAIDGGMTPEIRAHLERSRG